MHMSLSKLAMLRPQLLRKQPRSPERNAAPLSPRGTFFDIVDEVANRERLPFHVAMGKVRVERPDAFRAAFPLDAHAAASEKQRVLEAA